MLNKRNIPIAVLLTAAMLFAACDPTEEITPTLSVEPGSITLAGSGASSGVSVTSNVSWTAKAGADWLSVIPSSGKGNGSVTVTAADNEGGVRTGTITFSAEGATSVQVSVTQVEAAHEDSSIKPISSEFDGTKRASTSYQLLVYSFADSNGDGIGDFNGITSKMDYFDELGVTGLWLSPVHPASSYHSYDVTDYYKVNPQYGTEEDFKAMIDAAHAHNIEIYLDYVLNHSGKDNVWFKQALADASSPYRDYYFISSSPSTDYSKFPMLVGTSYQSGEWKQATSGNPTLTITKTDEPETTGNSSWNLWFWETGKDGEAVRFKDAGDGTYYLVKKISGSCGMLVRKYLNWDAGSKFGAESTTTLKEGEPLTLAADGADISFSGSGTYKIELSNVSATEKLFYMGCFSDWMPDLNYGDLSKCEESAAFKDLAASADKWINMGVDGLRLDAVKHICGGLNSWNNASNKTFLKKWYDRCNATYKAAGHSGNMYMVGEVFNEYNDSGAPYKTYLEALPSVFDFSFWWRLNEALNKYNGSNFVSQLEAQEKAFEGGIASLKLSNHDEDRTGEILGKSAAKEKQAAAILLTAPGKPYIYQGEELGYYGGKGGGDEYVRTPMNWNGGAWADALLSGKTIAELKGSKYSVEAQQKDAGSVLAVYESFSKVRNTYPALAEGSMSKCSLSESAIAAWYMTDSAGNRMLVVHNVASSAKSVAISDDMSKPVALLGNGNVSNGRLTLEGNSSVVFKLY